MSMNQSRDAKTYSKQPTTERTRYITCPVCGSEQSRLYWEFPTHQFVRCASCELVYQNPQPVPDDLVARYDVDYFQYELENDRNFYTLMKLGMEDVGFDSLSFPEAPRRFLDVGCATGMLLEDMQQRGWEVQGVEVCRASAEYGIRQRGVPIEVATLQGASFPSGHFSAAHFSHLIEHLTDPRGFLEEVYRILAPGGYALVTTPNVDGFQARLFAKQWRSAIPDHVCLFNKHNLRRVLTETGFVIRKLQTWGGLAVGTAPPWIKKPVDRMAKLFGFGDVMMFLAQKPE